MAREQSGVKTAVQGWREHRLRSLKNSLSACAHFEQKFGSALDRVERNKLATCFRELILPPRRRGRKPEPNITAATSDFERGLRGELLFAKYIPGWKDMSEWRREREASRLENAIWTRRRRNRKAREKACNFEDPPAGRRFGARVARKAA